MASLAEILAAARAAQTTAQPAPQPAPQPVYAAPATTTSQYSAGAALSPALLSQYREGLANASSWGTWGQPTGEGANAFTPNDQSPYFDPATNTLVIPGMASLGGGIAVIPNASAFGDLSTRGNINGLPQYNYDRDGNLISQTQATGFHSGDSALGEFGIGAAMMLPAFAAGIAGAGAGAAAGAGGATNTAAMGAGSAGLGSTGTGLTLGGGATGLTAGTGTGLTLAGNAVAPGMLTAAAPGAGAIGAGLGTTGFAAGTGSLLGAAALSGAGGAAGAGLGGLGAAGAGAAAAGAGGAASGGFNWTSLIGPAIGAAGGIIGANAASSAADAQLAAAREAQAKMEPWYQAGGNALNRLQELLGIGGNASAPDYGSEAKSFGLSDFNTDPGYGFRQSEGEKGLQRAAAANGSFGSGKYLKDAMSFNQGLASQEYGNAFNRFYTARQNRLNPLQSLAGQGQSTAGTVADLTTQAGNAAAAGRVGQANAITNGLTQGFSMYQNQQQQDQNNSLMNLILRRGM